MPNRVTTSLKDFDPSTVTSDDLINQPSTPFEEPVTLTKPEKEAQSLVDKIKGLTKKLPGEREFREKQREEFGVGEEEERVRELEEQLFGIQARAEAIPIEEELEALETPPTGRARATRAIRGRRQEKLLRENALKALTTSVQLNAARGRLTQAEEDVKEAVSLKFDPIREEIEAKKANVELIRESPRFTKAEKKRAEERAAKLEKEERQIEENEQQYEQILDMVKDLRSSGFDNGPVLNEILQATDEEGNPSLARAQQIAAEEGALSVFQEEEDNVFSAARATFDPNLSDGENVIRMREATGGRITRGDAQDIVESQRTKTQISEEDIPTFDEFVDNLIDSPEGQELIQEAEQEAQQTFTPERRRQLLKDATREAYNQEVERLRGQIEEEGDGEFTNTQLLKLERAGLLNATRQEQLDFLFGDEEQKDESEGPW